MRNKYQADFMAKKTALETLLEQRKKIERDYIQSNNIVNPDGIVPAELWMIDDDSTFNKALDDIGSNLDKGVKEAREALETAGNLLIMYGLSIIPKSLNRERQILENACFGLNGYARNYTTRMKMIEYILKFDTSHVPKWVKEMV